jgi:hypothetical protein
LYTCPFLLPTLQALIARIKGSIFENIVYAHLGAGEEEENDAMDEIDKALHESRLPCVEVRCRVFISLAALHVRERWDCGSFCDPVPASSPLLMSCP